jgi:hypothetical protein
MVIQTRKLENPTSSFFFSWNVCQQLKLHDFKIFILWLQVTFLLSVFFIILSLIKASTLLELCLKFLTCELNEFDLFSFFFLFFNFFFWFYPLSFFNKLSLTLCFAPSHCPHEYVKDLKWHDEAPLVGCIVDFDDRM